MVNGPLCHSRRPERRVWGQRIIMIIIIIIIIIMMMIIMIIVIIIIIESIFLECLSM